MGSIIDIESMISKSMCKDCIHRVSRIISSEGIDLVNDNGDILNTDGLELIHEFCSTLSIELDHIVLECTTYESKYTIADHFFINERILDLTK